MEEDAWREAWSPPSTARPSPTPPQPALGDAARLALWFSAWCSGTTSLDEMRDAVVGHDAAHDVLGLPGSAPGELVPLILACGALRSERASGAGLALPEPGDPVGLGGPAGFNVEAMEAGEAVVLRGVDLGLVPVRAGAGVVWRCLPAASRRQVPDLAEADTDLRRELPRAADALAALDVARWRPEAADELIALRATDDLALPPGLPGRAQRMIGLATRCRRIVALALGDDGGAVTAGEALRRREALLPLDRCARRALVAACSVPAVGDDLRSAPRRG